MRLWPKRKPDPRCRAWSGMLAGYRCQLDSGHEGQHKAVIGVTREQRFGEWRKTGETTVEWR